MKTTPSLRLAGNGRLPQDPDIVLPKPLDASADSSAR